MRLHLSLAILLSSLLGLTILSGCGGTKMATSNQPTTTPTNPPTTTPSPTPPSPMPTPTPVPAPTPTATAQYEAALLRPGKTGEVAGGQIIVNVNGVSGKGQVQATNGAASATYTITFLPFTHSASSFQVGSVMSDAAGNINGSFTFPQKGTFAGIFHLSAGTNAFNTEIDPMDSGVDDNTNFVFNVPLQRAGAVTPAIQEPSMGSDPLSSGVVVAGGGHLHVELHGAAPNSSYFIGGCGVNDSSSCASDPATLLNTDASGNGTLDEARPIPNNSGPALIVEIFRNNQLQYVSGFTVQ